MAIHYDSHFGTQLIDKFQEAQGFVRQLHVFSDQSDITNPVQRSLVTTELETAEADLVVATHIDSSPERPDIIDKLDTLHSAAMTRYAGQAVVIKSLPRDAEGFKTDKSLAAVKLPDPHDIRLRQRGIMGYTATSGVIKWFDFKAGTLLIEPPAFSKQRLLGADLIEVPVVYPGHTEPLALIWKRRLTWRDHKSELNR